MIIDPMIVAGLASVGAVFAFWAQLKGLAVRFGRVFVTSSSVEGAAVCVALRSYAIRTLRQSKLGVQTFASADVFVRPRNRVQAVLVERLAPENVFWRRGVPIWMSQDRATGGIKVSFIRGTLRLERLLLDTLEEYNASLQSGQVHRFRVQHVVGRRAESGKSGDDAKSKPITGAGPLLDGRIIGWSATDLGPPIASGAPLDNLILPDHLKVIIAEARFWRISEAWYRDRGIPWRRGWLLHGRPGTGKTSLARAIAEELDLPVFAYDLASLTNEELRAAWSTMLREAPCMALIEDADGVFHGRHNVTGRADGVTFDGLLNCIDGIERANGVFLVITTNDLAKIDVALGTPSVVGASATSRPGRIDRIVELAPPDHVGLLRVCRRVLPDSDDLWSELVRDGVDAGETVAQFQERCARIALLIHWGAFRPPTAAPEASARSAGTERRVEVK